MSILNILRTRRKLAETGVTSEVRIAAEEKMGPSLKLRTETKQDGTSVLNRPVCECRLRVRVPVCVQILVVLTYFYNFAV